MVNSFSDSQATIDSVKDIKYRAKCRHMHLHHGIKCIKGEDFRRSNARRRQRMRHDNWIGLHQLWANMRKSIIYICLDTCAYNNNN